MPKYFQVTMAFEEEQENGKIKERKEVYVIEDEDPTAATAVAVDEYGTHETFRVVSVTETRIKDVSTMRERNANKPATDRARNLTQISFTSGGKTVVLGGGAGGDLGGDSDEALEGEE